MTFYVPAHFRVDDPAALERFVGENAFGTLVTTGPAGLSVSHVPFLPERGPDGELRLLGHVARANGHWRELEAATEALAVFAGEHAYVSPTWYETAPSVPTWNYAVVHARGRMRLLPPEALAPLLDRLTQRYEEGRPRPWRLREQPPEFVERLLGAIVGFELHVTQLEGKFKLSQNRRPADVEGAARGVDSEGGRALAALMRALAERPPESR